MPSFVYNAASTTRRFSFQKGTFHYLTIVFSNCVYNGNVFDNSVETLEGLIETQFKLITDLEFRGVGCSMVRGDTDSLTLGISAGYYSSHQDLTQTEALSLRAASLLAISAISGLVVSELRIESTLIQQTNIF
jgi:hypothetical protein